EIDHRTNTHNGSIEAIVVNQDTQNNDATRSLAIQIGAISRRNLANSGAFDHMTKDPSELQSLKPSSQPFICTANGGTSPIIGDEPVVLTNALRLDTVLVVPTLDHNLLSVNQDILTQRTLGYGVKRHNLYFLELTKGGEKKFSHAFRTYGVEKTRDNIWLRDRRLGYISFGYLQILKPDLCLGLDSSALNISDKFVFGNLTMPWNLCNLQLTKTFGNEVYVIKHLAHTHH
ncbi:hypothetical protein KY284_032930, partial [Solanum tuberosum]